MSRSTPQVGLLGALVMLATSLLGSSVFVVPVLGVQLAGQASLVSWLLLIAFMLPMAMVFGRLGRAYPHAGGVSHWASRAFGTRLEWVSALLLVGVIPVGLPAALLLTMVFVNYAFALDGSASLLAQLAVLGAVYGLNRAGLRASAWVQTLIIVATLGFIAVLAWRAPISLGALVPVATPADLSAIAAAAGLMLWCFLGLEIVANLAEEFRNPSRDIPLSVIGGVTLAGAVYYLCASTVLAAGFDSVPTDALLVIAADRLGPVGVYLLALFGFLACFASLNTYINGFSRQLWSLADEGKLPAWLATRHAGVPTVALNCVIGVCALSTLVFHVGWLDLSQLIRLANSHFVLIYGVAMASAVVLLNGAGRVIAWAGALACLLGFLTLGWAAVYGVAVFAGLWWVAPQSNKASSRLATPKS